MNVPPAPILVVDHASRSLGGRVVVRDVRLEIARGTALGLLGVNGAGKTTTLRMLAGALAPSSGRVCIDGSDLAELPQIARARIGYLPETPPLHAELTVREFLAFCARLRGVARAVRSVALARVLERCELGDVARRVIGTLSKGYRQRVGLAQAILHEPALIVLDEPASGLDPVQAIRLRELIRGLARDHAVVLSTHVLPDVQACCNRVAILHRGEVRHVAALDVADDHPVLRVGLSRHVDDEVWRTMAEVAAATPIDATHWRVRLAPAAEVAAFAAAVVARGLGLTELRGDGTALEATFLSIAAADDASIDRVAAAA